MANMTAVSPLVRGSSPALGTALTVGVIAAATLAGAWYFQLVLGLQPCPLCLEQRYAYYLAVPLAAAIVLAASLHAPRPLLVGGLAILALAALANAVSGFCPDPVGYVMRQRRNPGSLSVPSTVAWPCSNFALPSVTGGIPSLSRM